MADDSLTKRGNPFNQLSSSVCSREAFQSSERKAKLEFTSMLLAQADALSSVALSNALSECSHSERGHYLTALHELIVAAREQLDDALSAADSEKQEA